MRAYKLEKHRLSITCLVGCICMIARITSRKHDPEDFDCDLFCKDPYIAAERVLSISSYCQRYSSVALASDSKFA